MPLGISKEFIELQNEILGFVSVSWQENGTTYPISWRVGGERHLISFLPYRGLLSGWWELLHLVQLLTLSDVFEDKASRSISRFYFIFPLLQVNSDSYMVV